MPSKAASGLSGAVSGAASGFSVGGPVGGIVGAVLGGLGGLFGHQDAPQIPDPTPTDLNQSLSQSFDLNNRYLNDAISFASRVNTAAQTEANRLMELGLPGYSELRDRYLEAAASDLENQYKLPEELEDEISRLAAERGIAVGGRGQFQDFSLLKDFGFNLVDYANAQRIKSLNTLATISGIAPRINPMSPLAFFISPQEATAVQAQNNLNQYNAALARAGVQAAADNYNNSLISGYFLNAAQEIAGSGLFDKNGSKKGAGIAGSFAGAMAGVRDNG